MLRIWSVLHSTLICLFIIKQVQCMFSRGRKMLVNNSSLRLMLLYPCNESYITAPCKNLQLADTSKTQVCV